MKLVIFGLSVSSSWGNGHATLWRGLIRELGERGHTVVFFERDVQWYAAARDLTVLPGGTLRLYGEWDDAAAREELRDADVGMVTSYCPDALAAERVLADAPRTLRVFYDLDTPVTLQRLDAGEQVAYVGDRGLGGYDLVLSYTGGRALDQLSARLGADASRRCTAASTPWSTTRYPRSTPTAPTSPTSAPTPTTGRPRSTRCSSSWRDARRRSASSSAARSTRPNSRGLPTFTSCTTCRRARTRRSTARRRSR
jgi:hypothetical protein